MGIHLIMVLQFKLHWNLFAPTQEKVDLAVKAVVEVAHPTRVILFGSWARGLARWDVHLDLAVVFPDSAQLLLPDLHSRSGRDFVMFR